MFNDLNPTLFIKNHPPIIHVYKRHEKHVYKKHEAELTLGCQINAPRAY